MKLDSKIPEGNISQKWTDYKDHLKLVAPNNRPKIDIIVVGTGLAGASAAASFAEAFALLAAVGSTVAGPGLLALAAVPVAVIAESAA